MRHVGFWLMCNRLERRLVLAHVRHVGFWLMFDRTDSATAGWLAHVRHVASLNPNIFSKNISMQHVRHMFYEGRAQTIPTCNREIDTHDSTYNPKHRTLHMLNQRAQRAMTNVYHEITRARSSFTAATAAMQKHACLCMPPVGRSSCCHHCLLMCYASGSQLS